MTGNLVKFDAAKRQLAEAKTTFDVQDVRDKAEALRAFAKIARDRGMEIDATELRVRAERRIGEMLLDTNLATGGRPKKTGSTEEPVFTEATLAELGVDKKLSMRAQSYARVPADEFEKRVAEWRETEQNRADRAVSSLVKAVSRPPKPKRTPPLPKGKYRVIYADPAWQFESWSAAGADRSAQNHYPTMTTPEICALPIDQLAADDCVLFLWATGPMQRDAFAVIEAWGFTYKTIGFTWAKTRDSKAKVSDPASFVMGNGYWTRANPEPCLLATRGSPSRRPEATDIPQLLIAPRGRHSEKPDEAYLRIERLVEGPYIELFARQTRPGWDAWGNEVGA